MTRAVLLGLFDGVHTGHMTALDALLRSGADERLVYTFSSDELDTKGVRKLLLTDSEKEEKLLAAGADRVIFASFAGVREMSAEEFVSSQLIERLHADVVVCGENFRFGKGAAAGAGELGAILSGHGKRLISVPLRIDGGEPVSTTRIRGLIESERLKEANRLLGYNYFLRGTVIHGASLGRRMGIRTINTTYDGCKLLPPDGVYSSDVEIAGRRYMGVTDIGVKPTVSQESARGVETHILGFEDSVYDSTACIIFNDFYRREKKFDSLTALKEQINADISKRKEEGAAFAGE